MIGGADVMVMKIPTASAPCKPAPVTCKAKEEEGGGEVEAGLFCCSATSCPVVAPPPALWAVLPLPGD